MRKLTFFLCCWAAFTFEGRAACHGRFVNPITDICWSCIFPITLGGINLMRSGEDTPNPRDFVCYCSTPVPRVGIPISFWEPVRLVDVTRTPYCLVNMGGVQIGSSGMTHRGGNATKSSVLGGLKHSFYNVHWYVYPVIWWLELLIDFVCLEKASFDLLWITEVDPTWNDDELGFLTNPEAVFFGNPMAQAACAADCVAASAGFPNDLFFWCGGCQGSLYPFGGTITHHVGGVQASLLATQRFIARLHRFGLLWGYMGSSGLCGKYPMPIIKKSQYKTQMTYPIPATHKGCYPLGRTEVTYSSGREFPTRGEDFGYLIWRKRNCCLL
ncbi:MAG: TraU family protein [Candidatus Paracaedimonas acanthamoebae]|jgi:conjugal transfer pilus assembly protein TraU|uniref:TraU family protein n=1 Tax=Candidatus Paracaedimonas acanthamoebae TaxID=244581 RepID=A0A8J7TT69_9PROT|nr:TraU family protein [Candidatus Paracaedimonas acanthamoebae]